MQSITLTIPADIDVNTDEGLQSFREANPSLHIERIGVNQVAVALIDVE